MMRQSISIKTGLNGRTFIACYKCAAELSKHASNTTPDCPNRDPTLGMKNKEHGLDAPSAFWLGDTLPIAPVAGPMITDTKKLLLWCQYMETAFITNNEPK